MADEVASPARGAEESQQLAALRRELEAERDARKRLEEELLALRGAATPPGL